MNVVLIILTLVSVISCAHICREDGLFSFKVDITSYLECKDGVAFVKRCPLSEDGVSYLSFDGKECVAQERVRRQIIDDRSCPQGTFYDVSTGVCRLPEPHRRDISPEIERYVIPSRDVTCPLGTTYDSRLGKCRRTEYAQPIDDRVQSDVRYTCQSGFTYDPALRKCRSISYVEPIQSVIPQNNRYTYTCPQGFTYDSSIRKCRGYSHVDPVQNSRPTYTCPPGFDYVATLRKCRRTVSVHGNTRPLYVGRYRRNGRFETFDENGRLNVNEWHELPWSWDSPNNNNGQILPNPRVY